MNGNDLAAENFCYFGEVANFALCNLICMSAMYTSVTSNIRAIGVSDHDIDLFESQYPVPHGITYNSYLVAGPEAVAVIDGVDSAFTSEWLENLAEALEGRQPDYLIVLHLEPDHSGSVADAMDLYPALKLVTSAKAAGMLPQFCSEAGAWESAGRIMAVGQDSQLCLGGDVKLTFVTAPMVHWPEVMVAFEHSTATLFSADAFGTFGTPGHFDPWEDEAARYYFNICGKFGAQVTALIKKLDPFGTPSRVCSLHGPVLEGDRLSRAMQLYSLWSSYTPDLKGVFIPYASIYGNTASVAARLAMMLEEKGLHVTLMDLARCHISEALTMAFRHGVICLAASSYDSDVFPPMSDLLHHLQLKGFRNRTIGLIQNGSWAPTACRAMHKILDTMNGITILEPELTVRTRFNEATDAAALGALADALAQSV